MYSRSEGYKGTETFWVMLSIKFLPRLDRLFVADVDARAVKCFKKPKRCIERLGLEKTRKTSVTPQNPRGHSRVDAHP